MELNQDTDYALSRFFQRLARDINNYSERTGNKLYKIVAEEELSFSRHTLENLAIERASDRPKIIPKLDIYWLLELSSLLGVNYLELLGKCYNDIEDGDYYTEEEMREKIDKIFSLSDEAYEEANRKRQERGRTSGSGYTSFITYGGTLSYSIVTKSEQLVQSLTDYFKATTDCNKLLQEAKEYLEKQGV